MARIDGSSMPTEPIKVLDGLVRGVILASYDFVRLSLAGLVIPVIRNTRRFWPAIFSANRRLSSLTYLVLWILLTVSIGVGTSGRIVFELLGLGKPNVTIPALIAVTLIIAMFIDVSVRAGFMFVRNRVRREMYEHLARIAVANIFVGACALMMISGDTWLLPPGFALIHLIAPEKLPMWAFYPQPILFLFSLSLVVVILKALLVKTWTKRIAAGFFIVLGGPVVLVYAAVLALWLAFYFKIDLFPTTEPVGVLQRLTQCKFETNQIQVSSFLKLKGAVALPINPHNLVVQTSAVGGKSYVGRVIEGQAIFVLSNSTYTHVDVIAAYEPKYDKPQSAKGSPVEAVPCVLKSVDDLTAGLDETIEPLEVD
jgi:hypothetical protein